MRRVRDLIVMALAFVPACALDSSREAPRLVGTDTELRAALTDLRPGSEVVIAAGQYSGGLFLENASGNEWRSIVIRGADPAQPPVFEGGGSEAWHLSDCNHLLLRDLVVRGFPGNGINVDDGGSYETPAVGISLERIRIERTGPDGNHDALKMSGVKDFHVKDCHFQGWGGSAVDLVGCHQGVIDSCTFEGSDGRTEASGIQIKGGSSLIGVLDCTFRRAGARAINAGGSTGLAYFRPPDATAEARDLIIEGCEFHGSETPIAAVGLVGLRVSGCVIRFPEKWIMRILQESRDERFLPCQGGEIEGNVFHFDHSLRTLVNVGPGTLPESFLFHDNLWVEYGADGEPLPRAREPLWPPK